MPGIKRHQTSAHRAASRARTASLQPPGAGSSIVDPRGNASREASVQPSESGQNSSSYGNAGVGQIAGEDEEEDDDDVPLREKVILCITSFMNRIGCCYYDPNERKLYLIEDSVDSPKFDYALNIIDQVNPHLTLISNRADEALVEGIRVKLGQAAGDYIPTLEIRPNREFSASVGRSSLLNLPCVSGAEYVDDTEDDPAEGEEIDLQPADAGAAGGPGLANAYNFMRLRKKRLAKNPASLFINALRLGGSVSTESDRSLETIACLFTYLKKRLNVDQYDGAAEESIDVSSIEMISLSKVMMINADTLAALQIFESEAHANIHASEKKDGLSLYTFLNRTRTPMGRTLLKRWLLQPSLELNVLNARYDAVDCFSFAENAHIAEGLHKSLNVKNIPRVLKQLIAGVNSVQMWSALNSFIGACIVTRDMFDSLQRGKDVAILQKFSDSFELGLFEQLHEMIEKNVDWVESRENHRICIMEGIDDKLDENRRAYSGLPSMLSRVATHLSEGLDISFCTSLNVVYFPQLGYLCAVPLPEGGEPALNSLQEKAPQGWTFQFSTEISVYFKCQEMRDLDTHLGDLHGYILDREIELTQEMVDKVVSVQDVLNECAEILAEIDVLLALADAARQHEWVRPHLTETNVIKIDQAKHPLVELCVDHFVPNDSQLFGGNGITEAQLREIDEKPDIQAIKDAEREQARAEREAQGLPPLEENDAIEPDEEEEALLNPDDSILILTGANASGKSVFLKTVALIVYMAHIGSFVPAEKAVIGITDKIMTRINTRESVSRGSSAFMIDLQQISFMLRNCTARSLLLIDEFGKGTTSSDGAGLFVGLIKYLVSRGKDLPKTLLATHFHEIFVNKGFLKKSLPIGLAHMELIIDRAVDPVNGLAGEKVLGVTPLYRLAPGLCLKSFAYHCAEAYGIPKPVADRALEVSNALSSFEAHKIMDPKMSDEDKEELEQSEEVLKRMLTLTWGDEETIDPDREPHEMDNRSNIAKLHWCLGRPYDHL